MVKTVAVVYVDSPSARTYDYLVHPTLGEVKVGERFYAEARDTVAVVEIKAIHVSPSKWANRFIFQRTVYDTFGSLENMLNKALLEQIRTERAKAAEGKS